MRWDKDRVCVGSSLHEVKVVPKQNKMSAFHAQNPTQTCSMVKNGAHTILKIKKRKVPQIFCFFSMVWGDLVVTRGVFEFSEHEKQIFYSATVR